MNQIEFLEELSKTRNGWTLSASYNIIRKSTRLHVHCPITAVCGRAKKVRFNLTEFEKAAARLGLPYGLALKITKAADGEEGRLRSRLLKAVGLK